MKLPTLRRSLYVSVILILVAGCNPALSRAQDKPLPSKSIDLDKELAPRVPEDRAASYYHYALSKWNEDKGDFAKALSEMRNALKFNETSSALHLELANLLDKSGDRSEAIREAEQAARLDPQNPDPHWLLANLYFRSQGRDASASRLMLQNAVRELELLRDLAPSDERAYYALGGAYFDLGEPERAVQAYEKFQSLMTDIDAGYREIAKYYDRNNNPDKVIEYLSKALQAAPDSTESLLMLASTYSDLNKNAEAIPLYRKLLELIDESGTADIGAVRRQLAASLLDVGESKDALEILQDLAKSNPRDTMVPLLLGRAFFGTRQFPEAIDALKPLVENDPDNMEAQFYLGSAYEQHGDLPEAARIFERLLEKAKNSGEDFGTNQQLFQQHLANTYQALGETAKAIALYEDMAKSGDGEDSHLKFLLINAYRVNRQFDKALAVGKTEFENHPKDANIALVYARVLADAGKTKEGADILAGLLQEDPSNLDIYINLSQIYLQGKKYAEAEEVLRRAEDRKLDSETLKYQLATVYERQKDFDRAESMLKEILQEDPKNAVALNYIGYMLADRGIRLQEALQYVKEALAIDPNNGAYLDSLGWALFKLNQLAEAEKYLLQAVDLVRNDPIIADHLGDLYFKTGDYQKAKDFWTRSLSTGTEPEETRKVREKLEKLQETLRRQKNQK
jgi:tetratricopeptide (TPR) repeat protein